MNESRGNQSNESLNKSMQEIFSLMNSYEQLVAEIQLEAKNFQEENRQLRENLAAIIEENNRLRSTSGNVVDDLVGNFRRDYIDMAEKIFRNLREQFVLCQKEKEMFEALYHRTAKVLEREVPLNSIVKIQTDHSLEVKRLKEELLTAQVECEKQTKMNKVMQINMRKMLEKLESVQASNKALSDANNELNEKIKQLETEKNEIEQLLEESNELNKEQMRKSTEAFQRMQESIKVADSAMEEVQDLLREKNLIQDEYDNLARTIGGVIEEAAERVDSEIEELKMRHQHEMASAKIDIERLSQTIEYEREKTKSAMQQYKALEEKLNSQDAQKIFLSKDLEIVRKILLDTEEKLASAKTAISEERESNKLCQNEVDNLKMIIENQKRTKDKWKEAIMDMTKMLDKKVRELLRENQQLKARRSV